MYPTLNEKLQKEWDEAEQVLYEGLVTEQVRAIFSNSTGYTNEKHEIMLII